MLKHASREDSCTFSVGGVLTLVAPERFEVRVDQAVETHVGQRFKHLLAYSAWVEWEGRELATAVCSSILIDVLVNHMNLANTQNAIHQCTADITIVNTDMSKMYGHSMKGLNHQGKSYFDSV